MKLVGHLPVQEIVFFRGLVMLVATIVPLKIQKIPLLGSHHGLLFARGLFGTLALTLYVWTIQHIPLATTNTLQYLSPIFTALIAYFWLKEKVTPNQIAFFALCFLGVIMLKGLDSRIDALSLILGILSALFSGVAYNCISKLKDKEHPLVIILYFPLVTIPLSGIFCFYEWQTPQGLEWLYLLMVGVFTQAAQYAMTKAYQSEEASKISIYVYTGLFYGLIFGYLVFDETYDVGALLGLLVIMAGVVGSTLSKSEKNNGVNLPKDPHQT